MISYTVLTTTGTMLANKSVPASAPEYICHLTNPCLWNGKTSPKLYVVVAGLIVNGATEDQIVLPFGLQQSVHGVKWLCYRKRSLCPGKIFSALWNLIRLSMTIWTKTEVLPVWN